MDLLLLSIFMLHPILVIERLLVFVLLSKVVSVAAMSR